VPSDISIRANSNSLLPSEGKGHRFDSYRVRHAERAGCISVAPLHDSRKAAGGGFGFWGTGRSGPSQGCQHRGI
jgi:hypothetical protein